MILTPYTVHIDSAKRTGARMRAGFTLLEVLMALALVGLLAAVFIGGSTHLLTDQPQTPHEVFWKAVEESRRSALALEREVLLRFDAEKKQFVILDGHAAAPPAADGLTTDEAPLKVLPVPVQTGADLRVEFLPTTRGGNTILVGGVLLESNPVPHVTFYPDGTCTAFRAQIQRNGVADVLEIDRWTCAPVLRTAEGKSAF